MPIHSNIIPPNRQLIQTKIQQQIDNKTIANSNKINTQTTAKNAVISPIPLSR